MATYAIVGATGHVGGTAAKLLLARGAQVRAIVRNATQAALWQSKGADAAVAALFDPEALTKAFEGADGIFVMTPTWFEADDMFMENARAIGALGTALRSTPASNVVLLSSIGAQHDHGTGAILKLHAMEGAFADLPNVTTIRAGWFMENFDGLLPYVQEAGVLPSMLAPLDQTVPMVATADIGTLAANCLQSSKKGRSVIEFEGPRRYAPRDVAEAFARVLHRPVVAAEVARTEWDATFGSWGLTPRSAAAMAEMVEGFNSGWIAFGNGLPQTVHGTTHLDSVIALARDR